MVVQKFQEFSTFLDSLPPAQSEVEAIERIQLREQLKRKLSGGQAEETHRFVDLRRAAEAEKNIAASRQGRGTDAEVGFARGESAYVGASLTATADALCTVLPSTLHALFQGRVSEFHARVVSDETMHLSDSHRRAIDTAIAHRLGSASTSQLRKLIEGHAYRLDRQAAEQRAERKKARRLRRRVTLDKASDDTVYITAQLPTHQGLAVMEALKQQAQKRLQTARQEPDRSHRAEVKPLNPFSGPVESPTGPSANIWAGEELPAAAPKLSACQATNQPSLARDETMADLFVELLTGQATANGVTAEIIVVMQDSTAFGESNMPGWVPGEGALPAHVLKDWLEDPEAEKFIRRMYTRPADGQLVALESKRRNFPKGLAKMFALRDDICATPWCNNKIKDCDHRIPWARGGPTSWANGNGLCKACNLRKELPGWSHRGTPDALTVITPTGHQYTTPTLPPISELAAWDKPPRRMHTVIDIAWTHAA